MSVVYDSVAIEELDVVSDPSGGFGRIVTSPVYRFPASIELRTRPATPAVNDAIALRRGIGSAYMDRLRYEIWFAFHTYIQNLGFVFVAADQIYQGMTQQVYHPAVRVDLYQGVLSTSVDTSSSLIPYKPRADWQQAGQINLSTGLPNTWHRLTMDCDYKRARLLSVGWDGRFITVDRPLTPSLYLSGDSDIWCGIAARTVAQYGVFIGRLRVEALPSI